MGIGVGAAGLSGRHGPVGHDIEQDWVEYLGAPQRRLVAIAAGQQDRSIRELRGLVSAPCRVELADPLECLGHRVEELDRGWPQLLAAQHKDATVVEQRQALARP